MTNHREWVVGAILACLWACGSPGQATIDQFFLAARSNDSATLAAMSAVSPPRAGRVVAGGGRQLRID